MTVFAWSGSQRVCVCLTGGVSGVTGHKDALRYSLEITRIQQVMEFADEQDHNTCLESQPGNP
jgi:hypothetical protein